MTQDKLDFSEGVVIILDALGMKGIWKTEEPNTVLSRWSELINGFKSLEKLPSEGFISGKLAKLPTMFDFDVRNFSDTVIIILTPRGTDTFGFTAAMTLTNIVISAVMNMAFTRNFLLRGAISFGKLYKNEHLCIGPAIDDAASWYEKADLVGVICTPHTGFKISAEIADHEKHALKYTYLKTDIPLKDNQTLTAGHIVNWVIQDNFTKDEDFDENQKLKPSAINTIRNRLLEIFSRQPIDLSVKRKFENTLQFLQKCVQ